MATNIVQVKWNHSEGEEHHEEEEEEEALSLSDLPINLNDQPTNQQEHVHTHETTQEEFNFRSWGAQFSKEPEMCAADEVFFQGQILPLRVSFSSEAGLLATVSPSQQHYGKQFARLESLNRKSSDFRSSSHNSSNSSNSSSRSSSLRSQNSSTSTSSVLATTTTTTIHPKSKPRIRNQFHTHPSPKPQIRASAPTHNQGRKSTSAWGIFRLGVVPSPEIGLQDLKNRNKNCVVVSRNSSNSDNNSSSNNSVKTIKTSNKNKNNKGSSNHNALKRLVGKGGGLLSGCDCTFETVQPNNVVMIKGGSSGNSGGGGAKSTNMTESTTHAAKEKEVELKKKQRKQGKKVTSRRRTFEWIKELHASQPDDEAALLSKAS